MNKIITQQDVDNKMLETMKRFEDTEFNKDYDRMYNIKNFLYKNYEILLKKKFNTRFEIIIIDDCKKKTLFYKPPEQLELNYKTICFYIALEELGIDNQNW